MRIHFVVRPLLLVLAACAGCGPHYEPRYPVHGKITSNGKPVTEGKIVFYPQDGSRSALAAIAADGSYRLTTYPETNEDGAFAGSHTVTISATQVSGPAAPTSFEAEVAQANAENTGNGGVGTVTWLVPESYSRRETTPLKALVEEKSNEINFDLPIP